MNLLREFFNEERKRVFTPGPFFTQRVMARLNEGRAPESGIWEVVPSSTRPVFAVALMLILCFLVVEMWIPQTPQRGATEAFLAPDQSPAESFLYSETDVPRGEIVLEQMIALEDQQQ